MKFPKIQTSEGQILSGDEPAFQEKMPITYEMWAAVNSSSGLEDTMNAMLNAITALEIKVNGV